MNDWQFYLTMKSAYNYLSMRGLLTASCLLGVAGTLRADDPPVSNVHAAQRTGTKLVDITYDLVSAAPTLRVTVAASADGGLNYNVPAISFSGDGYVFPVIPGVGKTSKTIVWDAGADWPGNFTPSMKFKVCAWDPASPTVPARMAFIPGGWFLMGDNFYEGDPNELPVHAVDVSPFYMDKFELRWDLWNEVRTWALAHGYDIAAGVGIADNHPVHSLNWYDVVKWCNARSEKEGRVPAYYTSTAKTTATVYRTGQLDLQNDWVNWGVGYRLPTEAEWEYAARGGHSGQRYPWGNTIDGGNANYAYSRDPYETGSSDETTPVGYYNGQQTPPGPDMRNGYGLYDMAGNVAEWSWDWLGPYGSGAQADPRGPTSGSLRVFRGGYWYTGPQDCRVAYRYDLSRLVNPGDRDPLTGFRCVLGPQ